MVLFAFRKLSRGQLEHVLAQLYVLFYNLPPALRRNETSPREFITQIRGKLEGPVESVDRDSASAVSEWLKTYIECVVLQPLSLYVY